MELIKGAPRALKRQKHDVSKTQGMSHNQEHFPGKWRDIDINEGQSLASRDIGPTLPKPSSPSEGPDSRILRGYCGARELVTPTHFALGPRPEPRRDIAEDIQWKSKWPRDIAEDDFVLGIPTRS